MQSDMLWKTTIHAPSDLKSHPPEHRDSMPSPSTRSIYEAVPICLEDREIRLVQISHEPAKPDSPDPLDGSSRLIHCKLASFPLSKCPPYIALSYTWGLDNTKNRILLDGTEVTHRKESLWLLASHARPGRSVLDRCHLHQPGGYARAEPPGGLDEGDLLLCFASDDLVGG